MAEKVSETDKFWLKASLAGFGLIGALTMGSFVVESQLNEARQDAMDACATSSVTYTEAGLNDCYRRASEANDSSGFMNTAQFTGFVGLTVSGISIVFCAGLPFVSSWTGSGEQST